MPDHNATRFFTLRCNYDNGALGWEHWALPALDSAINAGNAAGHGGYACAAVEVGRGPFHTKRHRPQFLPGATTVEGEHDNF